MSYFLKICLVRDKRDEADSSLSKFQNAPKTLQVQGY